MWNFINFYVRKIIFLIGMGVVGTVADLSSTGVLFPASKVYLAVLVFEDLVRHMILDEPTWDTATRRPQ